MTLGVAAPTGFRRDHDRSYLVIGLVAVLATGLLALPVGALVWFALDVDPGLWPHLRNTVLGNYVTTTALLAIGVGTGVTLIGVGAAWLVAAYEFPLRRTLEWTLMMPLAAPSYIVAFVYTDLLDYAGPVQGTLRTVFGWQSAADYSFPEIRSLPGAIIIITLVLYPYVYLLTRTAFLAQSRAAVEAARMQGMTASAAFWRVAMPMARPAIVVGVALALMETLNEYGTVDYFAVPVFSTGIFHVWINMGSLEGASGLALMLVGAVAVLLLLERRARADRRFADPRATRAAAARQPLPTWRGFAAMAVCGLPVVFGFLLPFALLIGTSWYRLDALFSGDLAKAVLNSLELATLAALIVTLLSLWLAYAGRISRAPVLRLGTRLASMGYAIPGSVLAIGILAPFAAFDNALDSMLRDTFGISSGLLFSGTLFALLFGCTVRFLALGFGATEAGFERVPRSLDDAARLLGSGPLDLVRRVHWPLLRASSLTAALLVFVDTLKELPMTLALRPFNFETLATLTHQYASDERFAEAAPGALAIVLAGILPVILLSRTIRAASRPRT
ncbi:MAG: iron ABC transporter permease [Minwuia sp.]|nr:iron ABC transporter permease [Minwuia sp.]